MPTVRSCAIILSRRHNSKINTQYGSNLLLWLYSQSSNSLRRGELMYPEASIGKIVIWQYTHDPDNKYLVAGIVLNSKYYYDFRFGSIQPIILGGVSYDFYYNPETCVLVEVK